MVIERGKGAAHAAAGTRHTAALREAVRDDAITAFERRVAKSYRHWSRWARRQDLGGFRIYDRDIPEFPLAIDCYVPSTGPADPRLHVQEVETGWQQSATAHAKWVAIVQDAIVRATAIPAGHIVHKQRLRRRHGEQHQPRGVAGAPFLIRENGLFFWINLEAYLDTGLFLDHRRMRAMVGSRASGRRVLNLFGYTGSFSVYAARGGAIASDTIDLSNTYLAWAARNFASNNIDAGSHHLVRAEALQWLQEAREEGRRYELIVCDPPAFSNSKSMRGVLDVQRDHPMLIEACLGLLAPEGELYFSTNLRTFRLDPAWSRGARCRDITAATRAEDFRDPRVHHAFVFEATP